MNKQIAYIFICLMFTSCLGWYNEPDVYYHLNDNIKKIADFNIGSYWIYYSATLHTNDTISVIAYRHEQTEEPFDSHYNYRDVVHITLKSTYWSCTINDVLEPMTNYRNIYSRRYCECDNDVTLGFWLSILADDNLETQFGDIQYLDNYDFNGLLIDNVICYTADEGFGLNNKYYFAANYGLIEMELINDSVTTNWTLVEYNIVK